MASADLNTAVIGLVAAVVVALIGLAGVAIGAAMARRGQLEVARTVIAGDREKLRAQLRGEAIVRAEEHRRDQLRDAAAEILERSDPELHARINYAAVVALIHRMQLMLRVPVTDEARLNHAVGQLGHALQRHHHVQHLPMEERSEEIGDIWRAQSEITESTRALLQSPWPETP